MRLDGGGTEILTRLLSASELRARVIAGNLANQNTPGYARRVVRFEDLLRRELTGAPGVRGAEPVVEIDRATPAGADGNNVTLELELDALRENRLLYETYAAMLRGRMGLLEAAITEGRR